MSQHAVPDPQKIDRPLFAEHSRAVGRFGLSGVLILFAVLGLLYDFTVPLFEKPDELKHFAVIQYIQTHRRLPVVQEDVYRPWDQEGTQPPLYHILAAVAVSWLDLSDFAEPPRNPHYADERSFIWRERGNNNLYLHEPGETWRTDPVFLAARLARWLSLLAGAGTIILAYVLARLTFGAKSLWLPLLAAALVAFIPQFLHVSSAVTNDGLSATLAAATLVLLALIMRIGGSTRRTIYLGLILGLGVITKLSLLYLLPLTGLVLLLDLGRHRSPGRLLAHGGLIGGLMLVLAGWWYWRNWQLYGDVTALNAHLLYRGGALDPRPTLAEIWQTELTGLELSFWAAFGAGQILLEPWIYELLGWLKYLILVGLAIGLWRSVGRKETGSAIQDSFRPTALILTVLTLWCLIIFVALLRWMQITPASWGRLLYPALPAFGVVAVWGLSQLTLPVARRARLNTRYHAVRNFGSRLIPGLLVITLFLLSLSGPFRYIQSAYAKSPLISEAEVPVEGLEQLGFIYDDALRLIGYRMEKTAVRPGNWLPVTLYWQAVRPIDKNYSAFVHLLGKDNQVIGQVNTYPDKGNWPTSMLAPGKVLEDTYQVRVAPEADAPAVIRLAIGIFEFEDPTRAAKPAVDNAGKPVEPIVGAIPLNPVVWPKLKPSIPLEMDFAGKIRLAGYDWPNPKKTKPGETVPLTLYWETLTSPGQNLNLFIHLVEAGSDTQVAGFDGPPDYPTRFWQAGNTIVDQRLLAIPPDLPPGNYELRIGWYDLETFARLPLTDPDRAGDSLTVQKVSID